MYIEREEISQEKSAPLLVIVALQSTGTLRLSHKTYQHCTHDPRSAICKYWQAAFPDRKWRERWEDLTVADRIVAIESDWILSRKLVDSSEERGRVLHDESGWQTC